MAESNLSIVARMHANGDSIPNNDDLLYATRGYEMLQHHRTVMIGAGESPMRDEAPHG